MKADAIVWAIKFPSGNVDRHTLRPTRREAVAAFCDDPSCNWAFWYGKGCRAVKFRLVPLATAKGES